MFDIAAFKNALTQEVNDNILAFWLKLLDHPRGGFYCYADFHGEIEADHPKAVLLHSRILWAFSAAYRLLGHEAYRQAARHAYTFLTRHALDAEAGGVYWMLDADGQVTDAQKHIYNQGFAIYALSEYYRATQDDEARQAAIRLFELIETHAYDAQQRGYFEAYDRHWQPISNALICDTAEGVVRTNAQDRKSVV